MKYYIFSNTDIIGPFKAEELLSRGDFLPTTLVCPEDKIDSDEQWKIAIEYEDFRSLEDLTEQEITQRLDHSMREKLQMEEDANTDTEVKDIKEEIDKKYDKPSAPSGTNNIKTKHPTTFKIARQNHHRNFFSYIALPIILSIILILGIYIYNQRFVKKENPQSSVKNKVVVQETEISQNNANVSEEIKEVVSSYYLDTNRGTIGQWFKRLFSQNIKDGYVENWLVEHLYENTYVVQYRLTKPRKEPIVYIFEVDYKDRTITSALNNATIDLLSGI